MRDTNSRVAFSATSVGLTLVVSEGMSNSISVQASKCLDVYVSAFAERRYVLHQRRPKHHGLGRGLAHCNASARRKRRAAMILDNHDRRGTFYCYAVQRRPQSRVIL